jgi:hypothetical protein
VNAEESMYLFVSSPESRPTSQITNS